MLRTGGQGTCGQLWEDFSATLTLQKQTLVVPQTLLSTSVWARPLAEMSPETDGCWFPNRYTSMMDVDRRMQSAGHNQPATHRHLLLELDGICHIYQCFLL